MTKKETALRDLWKKLHKESGAATRDDLLDLIEILILGEPNR